MSLNSSKTIDAYITINTEKKLMMKIKKPQNKQPGLSLRYSGLVTAVVLLYGMSGSSFAAFDTSAITINGRIVANTCVIDDASAKQTVGLADIADRDIKGKTGGEKQINIVLKNCGSGIDKVLVTASGSGDSDDPTAFTNAIAKEDGGATGVGLYFYQTDGSTKFKPDGNDTESNKLQPSQDNTLTYKASYVGTKDVVTAGNFSTVVNMRFEYQ